MNTTPPLPPLPLPNALPDVLPDAATDAARAYTLHDFDFVLPPELIAQHPAAERSASRLLDGRLIGAHGTPPVHRIFRELPTLLQLDSAVQKQNFSTQMLF